MNERYHQRWTHRDYTSTPIKKSNAYPQTDLIGSVIAGRYQIERRLTQGGMGVVYLGTQIQLSRPVAVKVLEPQHTELTDEIREQFWREGALLARLTHPNIVTIHDYGETDSGELYLVMEYVDGCSLWELVQDQGRLPIAQGIKIMMQVVRALREAHRLGIIHRDLKPENIMVLKSTDDEALRIKVLDFGLARLFSEEEADGQSEEGAPLFGSPQYMSPEQICGEGLDPRSDIYSFGGVFYFLISGVPPFSGETTGQLLYQHLQEEPSPLSEQLGPGGCPEQVEQIILRCLSKNSEQRYASVGELMRQLKSALRMETSRAHYRHFNSAHGYGPSTDRTLDVALLRSTDLRMMPAAEWTKFPVSTWVTLVGALFMAFGAWWYLRIPSSSARSLTTIEAIADEMEVTFESSPVGAAVLENGAHLGVTPFTRRFPRGSYQDVRRFVFTLEAYEPVSMEAHMDPVAVTVRALLLPETMKDPVAAKP